MTDKVTQTDWELIERLRQAARNQSKIAQSMAEAKSLRQADNTEVRKDLYSWPKPEEAIEWQAADRIASTAKLEARLIDEFLPAILHGDNEHRQWLKEAFQAFVSCSDIPSPRGSGRSTKLEAERDGLRELLRDARPHIEADRLIEEAKGLRGEIFFRPIRQLCKRIDTLLGEPK